MCRPFAKEKASCANIVAFARSLLSVLPFNFHSVYHFAESALANVLSLHSLSFLLFSFVSCIVQFIASIIITDHLNLLV